MESLLKIIIALLLILITWEALRIFFYTQKGVVAGKKAKKVTQTPPNPKKRLLVIGDCGTVSVGVTDPQFSIVGRIGQDFPDFEVDNESKNSMSLWYLERKLRTLSTKDYDGVLIHIGSLDTLLLTPTPLIRYFLTRIYQHTKSLNIQNVAFVSPCNLGSCPLFRFPLNHLYDRRSQKITNLFRGICEAHHMTHIPLYEPRVSDTLRYPQPLFAEDLIHPNDEGHGIWYKKMKRGFLDQI